MNHIHDVCSFPKFTMLRLRSRLTFVLTDAGIR